MSARRRGAILDRDGTLIDVVRDEETGHITTAFHPDQLVLLPGVVEGLHALLAHGFVLAIATNQPGPAKGQFSRAAVERTHAALLTLLGAQGIPISALAACLHHPTGDPRGERELIRDCACRKPKPGLLLGLVDELELDVATSWMIGDSPADLEAAHAAGLRAGLIFSVERCELCPLRSGPRGSPEVRGARFDQVVAAILASDPR